MGGPFTLRRATRLTKQGVRNVRLNKKTVALGTVLTAGAIVASGTMPACASTGTSPPVKATLTSSTTAPSKVLLAVTPTRNEVKSTAHGETIKVYSGSAKPLHVTESVEAFGQSGTGLVLQKAPAAYGADWLTVSPSSFTLDPGQQRTVQVAIKVPPHQVGQRNLAVVFHVAVPKAVHKGTGAVVSAGVASELIVDVPGKPIVHPVYALTAPGFSTGGSASVTAKLDNGPSNFYDLANGVKVTSGSQTAAFPGVLILAGSSVTEHATVSMPFIGQAHSTLYVDGKPVASATTMVIPVWQLLGALALIGGLSVIIVLMRRRRRHLVDREVEKRVAAQK